MSELHAATALAVLDRFDSILQSRRRTAAAVRDQAGDGFTWQREFERSTFQFLPVAVADEARRDKLAETCRDRIEARVYYEPLDLLFPGRWQTVGEGLATTHDLHRRLLCLPMANDLSEAELDEIAAVLATVERFSLG